MKKSVILLFILFMAAFFVLPAKAQIKFGVKGGITLTDELSGSWKEVTKTDNHTGYFIGPMAEIKIPLLGLGVDGALLYSKKGTKLSGTTCKQEGIEVPINLKKSFGFGSLFGVYFTAGPGFFYNFSSNEYIKIAGQSGKIKQEGAEISANFGAGISLLKHLQIGANYHLPVTNTAKFEADSQNSSLDGKSFKSKGWQFSVAYLF